MLRHRRDFNLEEDRSRMTKVNPECIKICPNNLVIGICSPNPILPLLRLPGSFSMPTQIIFCLHHSTCGKLCDLHNQTYLQHLNSSASPLSDSMLGSRKPTGFTHPLRKATTLKSPTRVGWNYLLGGFGHNGYPIYCLYGRISDCKAHCVARRVHNQDFISCHSQEIAVLAHRFNIPPKIRRLHHENEQSIFRLIHERNFASARSLRHCCSTEGCSPHGSPLYCHGTATSI